MSDEISAGMLSDVARDFQRRVFCILGVPFDAVDIGETVDLVRSAAMERRRLFLSTPNLNFLVSCQHDKAFRRAVCQSDLSIADGMPIIWIARLLGIPIRHRVAGSSLIGALKAPSKKHERPLRIYFFGGPDGIAERACKNINRENDGLECVGFQTPGFVEVPEMSQSGNIDPINASDADFLIVALGAKKGQSWIVRNIDRLDVPVCSHLGAVVNFEAGAIRRAPEFLQRIGLEWLWRIKEEPALWKRYANDGAAFLRLLSVQVLPEAIRLCWRRMRGHADADPLVTLAVADDVIHIAVAARTVNSKLARVRAAFTQAATERKHIVVELQDVEAIGHEFLGLVLILRKHARLNDRRLSFTGLTPALRNSFRKNMLEDLMDEG